LTEYPVCLLVDPKYPINYPAILSIS